MNKFIAAMLAASFGLAYAMVLPIRNAPASSDSHFASPSDDDDDAAPPIHIHHAASHAVHASAPAARHAAPKTGHRLRTASAPDSQPH